MKFNYLKLLLLATLFVSFLGTDLAQDGPKAKLVDRFGLISCEDLYSRTDAFLAELYDKPSTEGLVIIYPEANSRNDGRRWHRWIASNAALKNFAESRLSIEVAPRQSEFRIEFWKLPPGAERPNAFSKPWPKQVFILTKPFIFGTEDENGICPTFVPRLYARLLKDNPRAMGRIEVYGSNKHQRKTFVEDWLVQFENDFQLPRNRFIIVSKKKDGITYANFWFIPPDK